MAQIPATDIENTDIELSDQVLAFSTSNSAAPTIQSFFNQVHSKLTAQSSLSSSDKMLIQHGDIVYSGTLSDIVKAVTQSSVTGGTGLPVSDSAVSGALGDYATKTELSNYVSTEIKTINLSDLSWVTSGKGKYYAFVTDIVHSNIISADFYDFVAFTADSNIQVGIGKPSGSIYESVQLWSNTLALTGSSITVKVAFL